MACFCKCLFLLGFYFLAWRLHIIRAMAHKTANKGDGMTRQIDSSLILWFIYLVFAPLVGYGLHAFAPILDYNPAYWVVVLVPITFKVIRLIAKLVSNVFYSALDKA